MNVNKLKGYRVMAKLTQKDMAKALNVNLSTYNQKENNSDEFTIKEAKVIVKKLKEKIPNINLSADDIFFGNSVAI